MFFLFFQKIMHGMNIDSLTLGEQKNLPRFSSESLTQNQTLSLETKIDVAWECGIELLILYYNS